VDTILAEKMFGESQIKELTEFIYTTSNIVFKVAYDLHLTVIHGKVPSVITGAPSQQSCPICGATPKQFNDLTRQSLTTKSDNLMEYGISPFHAWILLLEFTLHLTYRNVDGLRSWRITSGKNKDKMIERKLHIQKLLWEKLALKLICLKQEVMETQMMGHTALRSFDFKNQKMFAEITGLEDWLIEGLHTI